MWVYNRVIENILFTSQSTGEPGQQLQLSESFDSLFKTTSTSDGHGYNCFTAADIEDVSRQDCVKPAQILLAFFVLGNSTNTSLLLSTLPSAMSRYLNGELKLPIAAQDGGAAEDHSLGLLSMIAARSAHPFVPVPAAPKVSLWKFSSSQTSESATDNFHVSFLLETFGEKMADRANWFMLFRALGSTLSDPRIEWSRGTLSSLQKCLHRIIKNLDFSRRIR